MGKFKANLKLPQFIPIERILGKTVFDSDLIYVGVVRDWTYSSDGTIKMVLRNQDNRVSIMVPFYFIERVGDHILLKVERTQFIRDIGNIKEPVEREDRRQIDLIVQTGRE